VADEKKLSIAVICGSLRKASFNAALARALPRLAPPGLSLAPAPPYDKFPLYNQDIQDAGLPAEVTAFADGIRAADGVIIVSPEYNWSVPGTIKNTLDWTSRMKNDPFKHKSVAIQSAAGGLLGGSRMQYHLRQVLTTLESRVLIRPEVFVNFAAQKIDVEKSEIKDEATRDLVGKQLLAFEQFVRQNLARA
jgi:chromate reductase